jgi:hypothetical protein
MRNLARNKTKAEMAEYLKRFEGDRPLIMYSSGRFLNKYIPDLIESEIRLRGGLYTIPGIQRNKEYKIIAGLDKLTQDELLKRDCLYMGIGLPYTFHKRVVEKMEQVCPNDFIPLQVTLISTSDRLEPYENKDFYIVNALHTIDALDHEKSDISYDNKNDKSKGGLVFKRVYKEEDFWQGHLMVFESTDNKIIYHPKLAKALYPGKHYQFLTQDERNAI